MEAPYRKKDGSDGARVVGDLVQRVIYHTWFHRGQVVAVRRLLGHEKVPQFVENTDQQANYVAEAGGVE